MPKLITSVGINLHLSEFFALLAKINDDIENKEKHLWEKAQQEKNFQNLSNDELDIERLLDIAVDSTRIYDKRPIAIKDDPLDYIEDNILIHPYNEVGKDVDNF